MQLLIHLPLPLTVELCQKLEQPLLVEGASCTLRARHDALDPETQQGSKALASLAMQSAQKILWGGGRKWRGMKCMDEPFVFDERAMHGGAAI